MALIDLFFGTDFFNRIGRRNIRGDELAALIAATIPSGAGDVGKGAEMSKIGTFAVPNVGTQIPLIFDTEFYDDLGFIDIPTDDDRIVIPVTSPQITRVQFSGFARWENLAGQITGYREMDVWKNGINPAAFQGGSLVRWNANDVIGATKDTMIESMPQLVVPGDFFQLRVGQNSASNPLDILIARFAVKVLR